MADWLKEIWHDVYANPCTGACALLVLLFAYLARGEIKRLLKRQGKNDELGHLKKKRVITGDAKREHIELVSEYVDALVKLKDSKTTTTEFFSFYNEASTLEKRRRKPPNKQEPEPKPTSSPAQITQDVTDTIEVKEQLTYEIVKRPIIGGTTAELIEHEARKSVAAAIMIGNGTARFEDIVALRPKTDPVELRKAVEFLAYGNWIMLDGDKLRFPESITKGSDKRNLAAFLFHFITQIVIVKALGTVWYDNHIDADLLAHCVTNIQMGLELNAEDIEEAVQLMRWSPSALQYALTPDPMIVQHRKDYPHEKRLNLYDRNQFMRSLYKSFVRDFLDPQLARYFAVDRGLTEINQTLRLRIHNTGGVVREADVSERNAIVQLGEPWNGLYVHVLGIDNWPDEPPLPADNKELPDESKGK